MDQPATEAQLSNHWLHPDNDECMTVLALHSDILDPLCDRVVLGSLCDRAIRPPLCDRAVGLSHLETKVMKKDQTMAP